MLYYGIESRTGSEPWKGSVLEKHKELTSPQSPPPPKTSINDAVIISDLHLGSSNCRVRQIIEFLERIQSAQINTRRLILNGDVFDSIDFRRLNKLHWKVLSLLRKLSKIISITWVCGNHDGPAEPISHLLGLDVMDEYVFESGDKSVLVLHGHQFDDFISNRPMLTFLGDLIYRFLQLVDRSHKFARFAKRNTKMFLRCIEKVRVDSIAYAVSKRNDIVCCGHTHHIDEATANSVTYRNSGCWTEDLCTYLTIVKGTVHINTFISLEGHVMDLPAVQHAFNPPELSFN